MKKESLSFKVPAPKHRAHRVLFTENTPFTPKVEKPKKAYQRKPKFVNRETNWF